MSELELVTTVGPGLNTMGLKTKNRTRADADPLAPTLKSVPFLRDAPPRALKAADEEARYFGLPGGWQLFGPGDPSDQIYFVLSGSLGRLPRRTPVARWSWSATSAPASPWAKCR